MTSSAPDTEGEDRDERNGEAVPIAVGGARGHDRGFDHRESGSRLRADQRRGGAQSPCETPRPDPQEWERAIRHAPAALRSR